MLKIRPITESDLPALKEIHDRYHSEFEFPNFKDYLCAYIIEDSNQELIMAAGVEAIAEAVLITDPTKSKVKIGRALVKAQDVALYVCRQFGIKELHAFVKNDSYAKHLMQHGFSPRSRALSMRVPNG